MNVHYSFFSKCKYVSLLINIPRLSQVKSPKEISDNVLCDKFILVYFE